MRAKRELKFCVVLLFAALLPSWATAQTQQQLDWCLNKGNAFSADLRISGCTAFIQSGRLSGDGLAAAFYNRGVPYAERRDYDRAIADYSEAIRLYPKNARVYNNRGVVYRAKNDYDRAIADYDEAIRLDPKYALAYLNRGVAYADKKDYDRAIADYNAAIRLDPKVARAYSNRGEAYRAKNDYDRALSDFNEAIRVDPNSAFAYYNRGNAYLNKKDYDRAIADYTEAIRLDPKDAKAYNNRGEAYRAKNDYDRAISDYTEAVRLDPKLDIAHANLNIAYRNRNSLGGSTPLLGGGIKIPEVDFREPIGPPTFKADIADDYAGYGVTAESPAGVQHAPVPPGQAPITSPPASRSQQFEWCANKAVSSDLQINGCTAIIQSGRLSGKSLAEVFNARGTAYSDQNDYDSAIADYIEALRLDPKYANAYNNRGNAYRSKNDYDRAIADYNETIRLDPKHAIGYNNRGVAYLRKMDHDRAIADFIEAIRLDPKDPDAYINRAAAYQSKNDYDRAIADLNEAIRVQPDYAAAYNNRCFTRAIAGRDLEKAIADCDAALSLGVDVSLALGTRGIAQLKRGAPDRAIADFSAAVGKNPEDAGALFGRGFAKLKSGDSNGGNSDITAARAIQADIADEYAGYGLKLDQTAISPGLLSKPNPRVQAWTREAALSASPRIGIDAPRMVGSISLRGGRIDDLSLRSRDPDHQNTVPVPLLSPSGGPGPLYAEFGWLRDSDAKTGVNLPDSNTIWSQEGSGALRIDHPVILIYDNGNGLEFRRTVVVDDHYLFTMKDEVVNSSTTPVRLFPYGLISRQGAPRGQEHFVVATNGDRTKDFSYSINGGSVQEFSYSEIAKAARTLSLDSSGVWLAIADDEWAVRLLPAAPARVKARLSVNNLGETTAHQIDYLLEAQTIAPGMTSETTVRLFVGPKEPKISSQPEPAPVNANEAPGLFMKPAENVKSVRTLTIRP
jgi:YidC/Oxa1 family membrane protein insertase